MNTLEHNGYAGQNHKVIKAILLMVTFGILLVTYRMFRTTYVTYVFFLWNIFLALIPFVISTIIVRHQLIDKRPTLSLMMLCFWLLFLPNSFYMVTDLFHLKQRHSIPLWYDLLLIFTFAWAGLMIGYSSLLDIHRYLTLRNTRVLAWFNSMGTLVLVAFGVYLGRYMRWNSWDLFAQPSLLLDDVMKKTWPLDLSNPAIEFTIGYSVFYIIGFFSIKALRNQ